MTAEIISLAERPKKGPLIVRTPTPSSDEWNHPSSDNQAMIRVLLHRLQLDLGLSLTAEDYGFLHRYGHLAR
jgi:hypothetical protein